MANFVSRLLEFLPDLEAEGPWPFLRARQRALHAGALTPVLGFARNLKSLALLGSSSVPTSPQGQCKDQKSIGKGEG